MTKRKRGNEDKTTALYKAVAAWLKDNGGEAVVSGGVSIISWPGESKNRFTVGIQVLGTRPKKMEEI